MNNLKAFVRYDGSGHIVSGSLILRQFKPTIGKWKEIAAYNKGCNSPVPPPPIEEGLKITFNSIPNADLLIGGSTSDVNVWNLFFELSNDNQYGSSGGVGTPFTSVIVDGNIVHLYGGANIALLANLFSNDYQYGCLVSIDDTIECIVQIRDGAFISEGGSCPSLVSVSFPGVTWMQPCFQGCQNLTTVNIPKVTYLGDYCFYNCTSLTSINLPLLTTTGVGCFQSCTNLTSPDFSSLTTAGDNCFYGCTSLTSDFSSLITADVQCFIYCTSLVSPDFPVLTTASDNCFYGCTNLVSPDFSSLTTAGSQCFLQCTSLTSDFPNLTTAGNACFLQCTSLVSPDFSSLTTAGDYCFQSCTSLTTINLPVCTNLGYSVGDNNVFYGIIGNDITLTVPSSLMTCNAGQPDGDVQYLQENNNVTIIYSNPI